MMFMVLLMLMSAFYVICFFDNQVCMAQTVYGQSSWSMSGASKRQTRFFSSSSFVIACIWFFSSSFRNLNNRKRLACFVLLWNRLMQWLKFEYMYMLWWKFNPSLKAKILFEISTVAGNRQKESGSLCSFKNKRISGDKTNSKYREISKHQANLGGYKIQQEYQEMKGFFRTVQLYSFRENRPACLTIFSRFVPAAII